MKNKLSLIVSLILLLSVKYSGAQTFNCFITNDKIISSNEFEFDVFIQSTSSDFSIRTFQGCFTFNPQFIPAGGAITVSLAEGSSELNSYAPGKIHWSAAGSGFEVSANTGVDCSNGTLITTSYPVRIGTYRLKITNGLKFVCTSSNPNMVKVGDPTPQGLPLKMAVTCWNSLDCSSGNANTSITKSGTYTQFAPQTAYGRVNNNVSRPIFGDDMIIDKGAALVLDAGSGYSSYLWSTHAITQTIVVNAPGTYSVFVTEPNGCVKTDDIQVRLAASVNSDIVNNEVSLFPNPVRNTLYVTQGNENIKGVEITNSVGQIQKLEYSLVREGGSLELNVSSLSAGIYFIELRTENQKIVKKFVKE